MNYTNRIIWIDQAKGIGIFLVVVGHMIRSLVNSNILIDNFWVTFVDRWIYAFHMPLFFLIAGLFIQKSVQKPLDIFLISRVKIIIYPYFIWSILQGGLQTVLSKYANNKIQVEALWNITYHPIMQFWFLYVLFILIVGYAILC